MNAAEPLISIRDLHKTFFVEGEGETGYFTFSPLRYLYHFLRLLFFPDAPPKRSARSVAALTAINLDVMAGETLGIIGDNGAGKTTLLRTLAGVLRPSRGSIRIQGRIASLLELGSEFSKEMSIGENLSFACALAGMSTKETLSAKAQILQWADLQVDEGTILGRCTPGDAARLAFATAMIGDPEVILADEVLTVGDGDFRRACEERIDRAAHSGGAVLFVSHDLDAVRRSCTRVLWLEGGRVRAVGPADVIVDEYIQETIPTYMPAPAEPEAPRPQPVAAPVCRLLSLDIRWSEDDPPQTVRSDRECLVECAFEIDAINTTYNLAMELWEGGRFLAALTPPQPFSVLGRVAMTTAIRIPPFFLMPGKYMVHALLLSPKSSKAGEFWKIQDSSKLRVFVSEPEPADSSGQLPPARGRYAISLCPADERQPGSSAAPFCRLVSLDVRWSEDDPPQTVRSDRECLVECAFEIDAVNTTYDFAVELWEDGRFLATLAPSQPFSVRGRVAMTAVVRIPPFFLTPGRYMVHALLLSPRSSNDEFWKIQDARKLRVFVSEPEPADPSGSPARGRYAVGLYPVDQKQPD